MSERIDSVHCPALGREIGILFCQETQAAANDEVSARQGIDVITLQKAMVCKSCPKRKDLSAS